MDNNLQVDTDEEGTLLVKLYEPLPSNLDVKSTFWVVEEISSPQAYNVIFAQFAVEEDDIQFISGPKKVLEISMVIILNTNCQCLILLWL